MSRDDFLKWDSGIMGIVSYLSLSLRVAERLPPLTPSSPYLTLAHPSSPYLTLSDPYLTLSDPI